MIAHLMEMFTEVLGFDVIVIDCSPSNSAINKAAALACDFILPPCLASLYSAGSIAGLLTSVLPGDDGWLGLHAKITALWRDKDNGLEPKADFADLADWLLPKTAPALLPITVSNYAMGLKSESMKMEPARPAKRGRRCGSAKSPAVGLSDDDEAVVKLSNSQFVYTIMNYVNQKCPYIVGNEQPLPSTFSGPLVRFRENGGRRVVNFSASVPISMPVSEQVGRPFVELQLFDFIAYIYGEDTAWEKMVADQTSQAAAAQASSAKRKMPEYTPLSYGPDSRVFLDEVKMMKARYSALAKWIVFLLNEKRGPWAQPVANGAAAAPAPPADV